ncbi:MAG: hypothetical protein A2X18_04310 [Bacteroidetes bacterium GWF2_40_14]|nr:MAG: hypothetical protein A2X18_04310 [Bacteroidetes bacterium GWF2_40_14]
MKKNKFSILTIILLVLAFNNGCGKKEPAIVTGADQTDRYLPLLADRNVAMTINQTSTIGNQLSLDSLLLLGINVVKGFGAEHGFRGGNSYDSIDIKSGVPTISLYRGKNKPTKEDLEGVDIMIFDMQDVGTRFYTYLATLHYIMEACAENDVELIILDRPNPNDSYVDGPVLEEQYKSFVGLDPIPILHGMTFGEYAQMLNGEGWLENGVKCKLNIITMLNYKHGKPYLVPIPPSPNLNTQQSILLYPSLCLFEGTVISQGRGTQPLIAFTVLGNKDLKGKYPFSFNVISRQRDTIPQTTTECFGLDLRNYDTGIFKKTGRINLSWLIELYNAYPDKDKFFRKGANDSYYFDKLAGTNKLREQIIAGKTEQEIRDSWEPALSQFKEIRKKYLIY